MCVATAALDDYSLSITMVINITILRYSRVIKSINLKSNFIEKSIHQSILMCITISNKAIWNIVNLKLPTNFRRVHTHWLIDSHKIIHISPSKTNSFYPFLYISLVLLNPYNLGSREKERKIHQFSTGWLFQARTLRSRCYQSQRERMSVHVNRTEGSRRRRHG